MQWLYRIGSLLIKVLFQLKESPRVERFAHTLFARIYNSTRLWTIGEGVLYLTILYVASLYIPLADWRYYAVSLGLLFASNVLFNLPLLLVGHGRALVDDVTRRAREREEQTRVASTIRRKRTIELLSGKLYGAAQHAVTEAPKTFAETLDDPERYLKEIVASAGSAKSLLYIMTPNAVYLSADRWLPELKERLPQDVVRTLEIIAKYAPRFRIALFGFPGDLHLILPDPKDTRVRNHFTSQDNAFRLDDGTLLRLNKEAANWILEQLTVARAVEKRPTTLHLTPRSPAFRFMITDDVCYLQELPQGKYGILQPVYRVHRDAHYSWSQLVEACLKTVSYFS